MPSFGDLIETVKNQVKESFDDFRETAFPERTTEQLALDQMYDHGYGQHFFDAYSKHQRGENIHPDDLKVLNRFGLVESKP